MYLIQKRHAPSKLHLLGLSPPTGNKHIQWQVMPVLCVCEWCPFPVHGATLDEVSAAPWLLDDLPLDGLHGAAHRHKTRHSLAEKNSNR